MRTAVSIALTTAEKKALRRWTASANRRLARRARIVLLAAEGRPNKQIGADLGTDAQTVARWRKRFISLRLEGIAHDAPRSGRKRDIRDVVTASVVRLRKKRRTWSTRRLGHELGLNHMLVYRILRDHNLLS